MGHGGGGDVEAHPLAHLAGIGAAGVDHVLADDLALIAHHPPFARRQRLHVGDAALADDLRAELARPLRQGEGGAGRIDMAVVGRVQRGDDAIEIVEGMQLADALRADQFHGKAQRLADAHRVAQPVELVFGVGEAEGAAAVPGDRLAGLGLQHPGIEIDVVADALAEREAGGGMGDLAGRVPGRAGGELGLFQRARCRASPRAPGDRPRRSP